MGSAGSKASAKASFTCSARPSSADIRLLCSPADLGRCGDATLQRVPASYIPYTPPAQCTPLWRNFSLAPLSPFTRQTACSSMRSGPDNMRDASATAIAVVSTPPVTTIIGDRSGRRCLRRTDADEDRLGPEVNQAPATVHATAPVHKRCSLFTHGSAPERSADVESEWRQSSSSESNHRMTIYLDARDESASEVSMEESDRRNSAST